MQSVKPIVSVKSNSLWCFCGKCSIRQGEGVPSWTHLEVLTLFFFHKITVFEVTLRLHAIYFLSHFQRLIVNFPILIADSGMTGFATHSQTPCPLRAPLVVTIVGLPCRGKSFAAHKVARHLCWKGELAKGKYHTYFSIICFWHGFLRKAFSLPLFLKGFWSGCCEKSFYAWEKTWTC